jgi:hypothetical protein
VGSIAAGSLPLLWQRPIARLPLLAGADKSSESGKEPRFFDATYDLILEHDWLTMRGGVRYGLSGRR